MASEKEFSLTKINRPENWEELTTMAKKHVPVIESPEAVKANEPFIVKVKVSGIDGFEHPNVLGHWINWVELYAGERLISRVEFAPGMCNGYTVTVSVTLNETSKLRARGFCNLHGVWEGQEKEVRVE